MAVSLSSLLYSPFPLTSQLEHSFLQDWHYTAPWALLGWGGSQWPLRCSLLANKQILETLHPGLFSLSSLPRTRARRGHLPGLITHLWKNQRPPLLLVGHSYPTIALCIKWSVLRLTLNSLINTALRYRQTYNSGLPWMKRNFKVSLLSLTPLNPLIKKKHTHQTLIPHLFWCMTN